MTRLASLFLAVALTGCTTVPTSAVEPGITYRAVGTEPFWALELTASEMVFTEANAPGKRISEPLPKAIHGFAGDIFQGKRINLNIVHGQKCSDGMSDRVYPDRVQVRIDQRSFDGCGGEAVGRQGDNWTHEVIVNRASS